MVRHEAYSARTKVRVMPLNLTSYRYKPLIFAFLNGLVMLRYSSRNSIFIPKGFGNWFSLAWFYRRWLPLLF